VLGETRISSRAGDFAIGEVPGKLAQAIGRVMLLILETLSDFELFWLRREARQLLTAMMPVHFGSFRKTIIAWNQILCWRLIVWEPMRCSTSGETIWYLNQTRPIWSSNSLELTA
jgi:hypothetical protein